MHQTVRELVSLGLVELAPDPASRSAKLVVPTARGRASADAARTAYAELERELVTRVGVRCVRELREALEADWGDPPV